MDSNDNRLPEEQQNEQDSRTSSEPEKQQVQASSHEHKHSSAASIDSIISSATENVRSRRSNKNWSNTGTNTSYEGASTTLGGGAAGTGETSGQTGVNAHIHTNSDYENGRVGHVNKHNHDEDLGPDPNERNKEEKDII